MPSNTACLAAGILEATRPLFHTVRNNTVYTLPFKHTCGSQPKAGWAISSEDGVGKALPKPIPFPAFLGGRGGASAVGDVGESVLVETNIWLVKAP